MTVQQRYQENMSKGGSTQLDFGLTAEQAAEAQKRGPAESQVAGWHRPFPHLKGGTLAHDRDAERIKDEADQLIAESVTRDEMMIGNVPAAFNERVLDFLYFLEENEVPARYPLPTDPNGNYRLNDDDDPVALMFFWKNVSATKTENWEVSTSQDDTHERSFSLIASKPDDPSWKRPFKYAELPLDTSLWDTEAMDEYGDFADSAFGTS